MTTLSPVKTPDFRPGDSIKIHLRVREGESERIQVFEGVVLRRRGRGASETFTVRKISFGIGVERIFPLNAPYLAKIEVVRSGKVRRSRLYYLRGLSGKSARLSEREKRPETPPADAKALDQKTAADVASPAPALEPTVAREA